jgi:diadenosine tetraphosphate (Ap4A) HIT family hydrolase
MTTLIHERVAAARAGTNPTVVSRVASGWVVLGDSQLPLGYSLLLPDPVVESINHLGPSERALFMADMLALGDALLEVTGAYRINYEILGNTEQALHAHVFARHRHERPEQLGGPVWMKYSSAERNAVPFDPATHAGLIAALRASLSRSGISRAP